MDPTEQKTALDTEFLDSKIESIPEYEEFKLMIDPSSCLSQELLKDAFICMICLLVAVEPNECNQCRKIVCGECISKWLANNKCCPNCRTDFIAQKPHPYVKECLENLEFSCQQENCGQTFRYQDA